MVKNPKRDIIIGFLMFFFTLFLAGYENWSVTDLVWSLWISSLLLGYAYIIIAILAMLFRGDTRGMMGGKSDGKKNAPPAMVLNFFFLVVLFFVIGFSTISLFFLIFVVVSVLLSLSDETKDRIGISFLPSRNNVISRVIINLPSALFLLLFFSIHFIFFHFIHSIFLNGFFPLVEENPFGKDMGFTVYFFSEIITKSISGYWLFIGASALSRFDHYKKALTSTGGAAMFIPYTNVVRMHITIFAVAFSHMGGVSSYALYIILIIYFLPIREVFRLFKSSPDNEKTA
jgi:hypothetical protein